MEKAFFDFVSILNKLKIPWWLDGGQLLRLYREDAFALNEVDFDIGVFYSDISKSVIKTILNSGFSYWLLKGDKDAMALGFQKDHIYYFQLHVHYVENSMMRYSFYLNKNKLLTCNPTEPELIEHEFITESSKPHTNAKLARRFDAFHTPFKPKEIIYKNHKISVPENVEEHLIESYGDDWKTPAKVWHAYKMQLNLKPTSLVGKEHSIWARDKFYSDKSNRKVHPNTDGKVHPIILSKREKEEEK